MLHKGMKKHEIDEALEEKGDYVQIDHLTKLSREELPLDIKKFVYVKLADIYERKGIFANAAKIYDNMAIVAIAFSEKIKYYVRSAELYIKAGIFDKVDEAMKKAMNEANSFEKQDIYFTIKNLYQKQAEIYDNQFKRNNAAKIYEKLLEMNITELERKEITKKLIGLYDRLGKFNESRRLSSLGI